MQTAETKLNELEIAEKIFVQYRDELESEINCMKQMYAQDKVEDMPLYHMKMIQEEAKLEALNTLGFKIRSEINKTKNALAGFKWTPPTQRFK